MEHMLIPVVDRPCLALVRQCRKKKIMEHCAKRWQTREDTYQLKRRRLKPDVRDPPEDVSADVEMADI